MRFTDSRLTKRTLGGCQRLVDPVAVHTSSLNEVVDLILLAHDDEFVIAVHDQFP